MAIDPKIGYKVVATVTGSEGTCGAGHNIGDSFEISCHNPAGLCGWFYHDIFPTLVAWGYYSSAMCRHPQSRNHQT